MRSLIQKNSGLVGSEESVLSIKVISQSFTKNHDVPHIYIYIYLYKIQYVLITLNLQYDENKLYKFLNYWFRDMLNFNFPEKGLELVSPPHFPYDFSRKMFLILYSINRPNFKVWLSFTSRDIGQYVYYNCLLTSLWRHKIWN